MTLSFAVFALLLVAVFLGPQAYWAWKLALLYPPPQRPARPDDQWPRVVVVLPTRGADPSLVECLEGLLHQDYPHYDIRIVVDSEDDPAWGIVAAVRAKNPSAPLRIELLKNRRETCSLKVSALLQALEGLDDTHQAAALIDGDVIPHREWLRDLTAPLADPSVGAATGVRWYVAAHHNWGSLVRTTWNGGAAAQMVAFGIPWAGSLAFRTDLLRRGGVREVWAGCFCEDVPLHSLLRGLGMRLHFVPAATMINDERISLKSCFVFVRRQLFSVRLYHPGWPWMLTNCFGCAVTLPVWAAALAATLFAGQWAAAAVLGVALAAWAVAFVAAFARIEASLSRMAAGRGGVVPAAPPAIVAAALLTPFFNLAAMLSAGRLRKIEWRGVAYELRGARTLRMIEYRPYRPAAGAADPKASVL